MKTNQLVGSQIITQEVKPWLADYYNYIKMLLQVATESTNESRYYMLNVHSKNAKYTNTIRLGINYEHTLVKPGGRSVPKNTPHGNIMYKNDKYLVRLCNYKLLSACDIIIDYSNLNIQNVKGVSEYKSFTDKHVYVAPCVYDTIHVDTNNRDIQCLTLIIDTTQPRRKQLLNNIKETSLEHVNIKNCYGEQLQQMYRRTKILANIHQTPHHDTFEELRCLPAIQNGVLVVSEPSPLKELIPYSNLIIWAEYDNIVDKIIDVYKHYKQYHEQIYTQENIQLLEELHETNIKTIQTKLALVD